MSRQSESMQQRLAPLMLGVALAIALPVAAQADGGGHWSGGGHWGGQSGVGHSRNWNGAQWNEQGGHWNGQGQHWSGQTDMNGMPHSGSGTFPRQSTTMPPRSFSGTPHHAIPPRVVVPPRVVGSPRVIVHPRVVAVLPPHRHVFFHHGTRFIFVNGVFFRPFGPRFITVIPPVGLIVPFLPVYASVVWIAGSPYYYADDVYYTRTVQGYVVTQPPVGETITEEPVGSTDDAASGVAEQPAGANAPADATVSRAPVDELYVYPTRGQSVQQQAKDRDECRGWAIDQTGYDPNASAASDPNGDKLIGFQRAQSACLEGRGYTVR